MAEKKTKQYVSDNPKLIAEWNWEKNKELNIDPTKVTVGSDKKVWWNCSKGHEWQAVVHSRNNGCGCPFCAGIMPIKGENDLKTINPTLANEWNYEKNNNLKPEDVLPNSHKKVWWKCRRGHEWQATVSKRNLRQNCPFCFGKVALKGCNDLASTNPELVFEWDSERNKVSIHEYRPMSNKKVWWVCDKGHSWEAVIAKRVNGEKCPICQGKKILAGFNDLSTTHPSLLSEWDYTKNTHVSPCEISKGSMLKVWWKCSRNHSWQSAVYSRVSGIGCPFCAKEVQSSFPEKAVYFYVKKLFPDAIANYRSEQLKSFELDVFIPSLNIGIEYDGDRWHSSPEKDLQKNQLCAKMGILLIRIREPACPILADDLSICIVRESKKSGLSVTIDKAIGKICDIANVECTINVDLDKDNADILELLTSLEKENNIQDAPFANEWDYQKNGNLLPNMVTFGSDKKVWWKCSEGHEWIARIGDRSKGTGCPYCARQKRKNTVQK